MTEVVAIMSMSVDGYVADATEYPIEILGPPGIPS
jgi:hypothetical protein